MDSKIESNEFLLTKRKNQSMRVLVIGLTARGNCTSRKFVTRDSYLASRSSEQIVSPQIFASHLIFLL